VTTVVEGDLAPLWPGGPVALAPHGLPRKQWLGTRKRGIGGSDVGGILGLDPRNSPLSVYMDKRGELPDDDAGEAAEWGNLLEPVVAQKWADDRDKYLWSPGVLAHAERPWDLANPDRLYDSVPFTVGDGRPEGGLEVKTANQYLGDDWDPDSDRMPARARLQVQHYLGVTGLDTFDVAALIGGQCLRVFTERRDDELIAMVQTATERFWHDHVLPGVPPPIDGSQATTDLLGRLYEVPTEDIAVLDPAEVRPLLLARVDAKAAVKAAEEHERLIDNQLKALLGERQVGVVDGQTVLTWKQQHRAGFEVAPTSFRVLRVPKRALDALT
jgi:putative phage-type endonuclease